MARAEANPTPALLTWARTSSGLAIDAAAKRATVATERLAAWEAGEQKPTFAQLRKLAVIYKRPLAIFYLLELPRQFEPMHDFRRAAEPNGLPQSPELTLEVRRARDRREWALELLRDIEEEPPQIRIAGSLEHGQENASAAVRDSLGLSLYGPSTCGL